MKTKEVKKKKDFLKWILPLGIMKSCYLTVVSSASLRYRKVFGEHLMDNINPKMMYKMNISVGNELITDAMQATDYN